MIFRYDNTHKIISAVQYTLQTIQPQYSCLKKREEIHLNKKRKETKAPELELGGEAGKLCRSAQGALTHTQESYIVQLQPTQPSSTCSSDTIHPGELGVD